MAGYDDRDDRDRRDERDRRDDRDDYEDRGDGGGRRRALEQVKAPAICLLVAGILYILAALANLVRVLLTLGMAAEQLKNQPQPQGMDVNTILGASVAVVIVMTVFALVIGGLMIFGALKMKDLQSRGLVLTACIVGMLPCSACCLVSLPVGIWSLVVINNAQVQPYFR